MRRRGHKPLSHLLPWSGWLVRSFMGREPVLHHGVTVYCDGPDDVPPRILERVTAALDELRRFDPRRLDRLIHDGVVVVIGR
jgi:hypothetical protein